MLNSVTIKIKTTEQHFDLVAFAFSKVSKVHVSMLYSLQDASL